MRTFRALAAIVATGLIAAACASTAPATVGASLAEQGVAEEDEFDCEKLTGRMQIRILELRSQHASQKASGLSKGMESIIKPILSGGTPTDFDARTVADVRQLKDDNDKLAANDCPAFDLEKDLTARPSAPTPQTVPREKSKKK